MSWVIWVAIIYLVSVGIVLTVAYKNFKEDETE